MQSIELYLFKNAFNVRKLVNFYYSYSNNNYIAFLFNIITSIRVFYSKLIQQ